MLRIHRFAAATIAIAMCATAPAMAQTRDLRSPDTIDAARCGSGYPVCSEPRQDLRSPDAVDAADPRHAPAPAPRVRIVEVPSSDFEWGDAGIGAAGMLGIVALGAGAGLAGAQRRRSRRITATR